MSKIVPIKEFRKNLAYFADLAQQGDSIIVIRRSAPVFKVVPIEHLEVEDKWENEIDFTEGEKKKGIPAKKLLEAMEEFEKKHG